MYKCKYCGKKGTWDEIKKHRCVNNEDRTFVTQNEHFVFIGNTLDDDISSIPDNTPDNTPDTPEVNPGGGEFEGGGASGSFDSDNQCDSGSSDSGSSDCGSSSSD